MRTSRWHDEIDIYGEKKKRTSIGKCEELAAVDKRWIRRVQLACSCIHPFLVHTKSLENSSVRACVGEGKEVRNVCDISTSEPDLSLMLMSQHPEMEISAPSQWFSVTHTQGWVLTFREITLVSEASELDMQFCYCVRKADLYALSSVWVYSNLGRQPGQWRWFQTVILMR